jgi:hypothetical protein
MKRIEEKKLPRREERKVQKKRTPRKKRKEKELFSALVRSNGCSPEVVA